MALPVNSASLERLRRGSLHGCEQLPASSSLQKTDSHPRPETELLIACARTSIDSSIDKRIRHLLAQELDWAYTIRKAHQNGVMPLLCWNILNNYRNLVPQNVLDRFKEFFDFHARHNLYQTGSLIKIMRLFKAHGISALPFKGPTLAAFAYGNLSLRQFGDLDILVNKRDLLKTVELLVKHDYKLACAPTWLQRLPTPMSRKKDYGLISNDGQVKIELHWRLSGVHFNLPLVTDRLWENLETVVIAGTPICSLPPNDLLLYLCVHGSRHGWERLEWISDIAELIQRHSDFDWEQLVEQSQRLGCERVVELGLFLASELLGAQVPPVIRRKIHSDPMLKLIAAQVRRWLFREAEDEISVSSWYRYHLWVKERARDRFRLHTHYYFRYLQIALKPNYKDRELLLLPSPLYYLVRPLRLVRERAQAHLKRIFK